MPARPSVLVRSLSILAFNLLPGLALAPLPPADETGRTQAPKKRRRWRNRPVAVLTGRRRNDDISDASGVRD